jgi:Mor family transcriptional regulator
VVYDWDDPRPWREQLAERNRAILVARLQGATTADLVRRYRISPRQVYNVLKPFRDASGKLRDIADERTGV